MRVRYINGGISRGQDRCPSCPVEVLTSLQTCSHTRIKIKESIDQYGSDQHVLHNEKVRSTFRQLPNSHRKLVFRNSTVRSGHGDGGSSLLASNVNGIVNGNPRSGGIHVDEFFDGITLDTETNFFSVNLILWGDNNGFSNLSGVPTAVHIHFPTNDPAPGGVVQDAPVGMHKITRIVAQSAP